MTLHPITVVDQVLEEYRSYLSTEFRARDEALRTALEQALDKPGFLAQEPFFQARRPFKNGKRWTDLGLDPALAAVMEERSSSEFAYLHQSDAISHLLSDEAGPLVVTTGTGSGKTECFLLPVIQNAIDDAIRFKHDGLTAILVYPMNALANDQEQRIHEYLEATGHTHVEVARYDRSTKEVDRQRLRKNPPRILLTNYIMLEYLLVRPADRDDLFANHRCRFVVLDEVHTYRGSLGANIALLYRRLITHLKHARQDWKAEDPADSRRFPQPLTIATSATIKSVDEVGKTKEEVRHLRDEAVQGFLSRLTGIDAGHFKVLGEEIQALSIPGEAARPTAPVDIEPPQWNDPQALIQVMAALANGSPDEGLESLSRKAGILWKHQDLLARLPMSMTQIVERIRDEVPERSSAEPAKIRTEVTAALIAGAALPDDIPGALRLRTHRFIRGGWRFTRCIDPQCGRLYPMGEGRCECGSFTAPLYLCRSCGADTLRFRSNEPDKELEQLYPNADRSSEGEWFLYDRDRFEATDDESLVGVEKQMRERQVQQGSFDPASRTFSVDEERYSMKVVLAPAANRCLVCGGAAGARDVITPVALGTSAAVRVIAEGLTEGLAQQHAADPDHDDKERLLIFSDSRQDAAHQARFITYAGRYDRMRRRVVRALGNAPEKRLSMDELLKELVVLGVERKDNPHTRTFEDEAFLNETVRKRARAWEEAPLLDDLAVTARYRASLFNLGLVGVRYDHLLAHVQKNGAEICSEFGIGEMQLQYLCRCVLDEIRQRGALSRPMLLYHPANPGCPDEFGKADWERRFAYPHGFVCEEDGTPLPYRDRAEFPSGVSGHNAWRRPKAGGKGPSLERILRDLLQRFGGIVPTEGSMVMLLDFLRQGPQLLVPTRLHGYRQAITLLQVNADAIRLEQLAPEDRFRCSICNTAMPWAETGLPCPRCHGTMQHWDPDEIERDRYVQRIRKENLLPLVAGEHTAQITGDDRIALEENFKGPLKRSPINVLACSPTLEMGIDVGGLDAVVMRNVPPRPDNYAQRGGRAGRRSRVGIVLGYARSTPHDAYFFDKPTEMIAGEVPAPAIGLGNRDVVLRHLAAMVLGKTDPGLAGRMAEYINIKGELNSEAVELLIRGLEEQFRAGVELARESWGAEILAPAGLATEEALLEALDTLPDRIRNLMERVRLQILKLQETIDRWVEIGKGDRSATHAMNLKRKLLGIRDDRYDRDADDRSGGHPMRRFAEFGILPGYEFPSEPATLRLYGDPNEDASIAVGRRFGITQYQPDAKVHARGHRWKVVGLDLSSPWNPKSAEPDWIYIRCKNCGLARDAQTPRCPRCGSDETKGKNLPGHDFGGFLAVRDDTPVLQEEDRFAMASRVRCHPQRDGRVIGRYRLATGWFSTLNVEESIRWVNESAPPTAQDLREGRPTLHDGSRGFYLCPSCGRMLVIPETETKTSSGRRRTRRGSRADPYGHAANCDRSGQPPVPCAITTSTPSTTLRIEVYLPENFADADYLRWGYSLGYSLRTGMRGLYMLDGSEIEFELESEWEENGSAGKLRKGAMTFIDSTVGGSGFLDRAAEELNLVAARAIDHLDHGGSSCDTACYRCLKSYRNQRHHEYLSWPQIMPDLEQLASEAPAVLPAELGDRDDPKPWLEAYEAGVGSPLELKFLRLFEKHGIGVEKQVPVSEALGRSPISTADFVVAGTKIAIYIDGAAFHHGQNLRRDRHIRNRLREGETGWTIIELRAADLSRAAELIAEIVATVTDGKGD